MSVSKGGVGGDAQAAVAANEQAKTVKLITQANDIRAAHRQGPKQRIPVRLLGPHPSNRGTVFPNEARPRTLACEIICVGFSQAEADFEGVCVKEYSVDEQKNRADYESFVENARKKAKGIVKDVFDRSGGEILYGTLSHSHLAIILRAIAAGAKWELPSEGLSADQLKILKPLCDSQGLLDMAAVAAKDEVANTIVHQGMLYEVLHPDVMKEPTACSTIAQAINRPTSFAMRMSEVEALKVLSSTINEIQATDHKADYQSVMEAAAPRLGHYAADPSFVDFFNFVLNLGADGAPHIKELITFAERFVNSAQRSLSLPAFALVGGLRTEFPRTKVALIMRAYKMGAKKAGPGGAVWCKEPEAAWKKQSMEPHLRLMEDVLHGHHVTLKAKVAEVLKEKSNAVDLFLINLNIQCASHMANVAMLKDKCHTSTKSPRGALGRLQQSVQEHA